MDLWITLYKYGKVYLRHYALLNYRTDISKIKTLLKILWFGIGENLLRFYSFLLKKRNVFNQQLKLRSNNAVIFQKPWEAHEIC